MANDRSASRLFPEHFDHFDGGVFLERRLPSGWSICAAQDPRLGPSHYVLAFFDRDDEPIGEVYPEHRPSSLPWRRVGGRRWRLPKHTGVTRAFSVRERRAVSAALFEIAELARLYDASMSSYELTRWYGQL